MSLIIQPQKLTGRIVIQPSKSLSHRALICAALAAGVSTIENLGNSLDITATKEALQTLGLAAYEQQGALLRVTGRGETAQNVLLDCHESGSTLRFLLPITAALGIKCRFAGRGQLLERPLDEYLGCLNAQGAQISWQNQQLEVAGKLQAGKYLITGGISSQYVSGLLFALPLLAGTSQIALTSPLQSSDYAKLTEQVQLKFGVTNLCLAEGTRQIAPQQYKCAHYTVEGDWSHAAFFALAAALGGDIRLAGLNFDSLQGDKTILALLDALGCEVGFEQGEVHLRGARLQGLRIDAGQIPDLVPALAVAACGAQGKTTIYNAARLRLKESDRLAAISAELNALGGEVEQRQDGLVIQGHGGLRGGVCEAHNDHRVAMALAMAASICEQPVELHGFRCVAKSAPDFWQEYAALGGQFNDSELGS